MVTQKGIVNGVNVDTLFGVIDAVKGNPKVAEATFAAAFPTTDYAIVITPRIDGTKHFSPNVTTQVPSGFWVDMGANSISGLVHVAWTAIEDGESE